MDRRTFLNLFAASAAATLFPDRLAAIASDCDKGRFSDSGYAVLGYEKGGKVVIQWGISDRHGKAVFPLAFTEWWSLQLDGVGAAKSVSRTHAEGLPPNMAWGTVGTVADA